MGLKMPQMGPIVTGCKALEILPFSFRTNVASAPDRIRDAKGNLVATVTRTPGAGRYTVQLIKPYPRQLIAWCLDISTVAAATTDYCVRFIQDSYVNTTGQFTLQVVLNDGTNAVEDPPDDAVISFVGFFIPHGQNTSVQP